MSLIFPTAARADSLDVLGAKVTWADKLYSPTGCSSFEFSYVNGTGLRLLQFGFIISDPFGRKVEDQSAIGVNPGASGTWNSQICSFDLSNGLGPYTMKVYIQDYSSNTRQTTKDISFIAIPNSGTTIGNNSSGSLPAPAPTVTVTARPEPAPTVTVTARPEPAPTVTVKATDPALQQAIVDLTAQLKNVSAQLKKVCSVKPKPKYC